MEDNLKILIVKYLGNQLLDHTQILNLRLYDQSIFYESLSKNNVMIPIHIARIILT